MNSPVDKIKERLSIVDVISSYLTVEPSGKNFKARCPFHNEKTPSFFISPDRGTYYCFGCGAKGDIFSFVEKFEGTDFLGSLKMLALRAGVELSNERSSTSRDQKETWYDIMEEATKFFEKSFLKNPEARAYLIERGVSDETISSFRIGYAEDKWRSVSEYLLEKGFKKADIEIVGLIKTKDDGYYDRFRSRIMFPISDSSGRTIAFSGRIFFPLGKQAVNGIEEAKYLNSPDTPLFNKSNVLFGIDKAKSAIRTRGYSIIVEGQMDLILSHQAGFTNTVAVSGTALSDTVTPNKEDKINNLGLIRRLSPNVIFAYDGDEAGVRAASRSSMIALSLEMQAKIALLPEGKDPADIIFENQDQWKAIIKDSVNIVSFHIDRICKSTQDLRIRGRKIREIVFPFLIMVKSAIERQAYITEIYQKTAIAENAIIEDFQVYEQTNSINQVTPLITKESNIQSRKDSLERRLFGILFWQERVSELPKGLKELLGEFKKNINEEEFNKMKDSHIPFTDILAFEAEMWYGGKVDTLERDVREIMLNLEEEIINETKTNLHPLDTEDKLNKLNILLKRIEEIKQSRSI